MILFKIEFCILKMIDFILFTGFFIVFYLILSSVNSNSQHAYSGCG